MRAYSGVENRQADVYVGVDVFARGDVVGGKFDTNKVNTVLIGERMCYYTLRGRFTKHENQANYRPGFNVINLVEDILRVIM